MNLRPPPPPPKKKKKKKKKIENRSIHRKKNITNKKKKESQKKQKQKAIDYIGLKNNILQGFNQGWVVPYELYISVTHCFPLLRSGLRCQN